jgi:peptidoglycan hydrolase-like protein with peptidoglycan-binding domain
MRRITDSLLKSIVRQSLNESYGLLNEDLQEVTPYDITTIAKHGTVPKGAFVTGMTYEPCPEGGFCFEYLETAKSNKDSKSATELINIFCSNTKSMGKQTRSGTDLSNVTQNLFAQLTEFGMNTNDIVNGLTNLADFPTLCAANAKFKKLNGGAYPLGIPGTSGKSWGGDYGIENAYEGPRNKFYGIIEGLFENSITTSDEYYGVWKKQLEEKYKITQDAKNKNLKDIEDKKKNDLDLKAKLTGGGSWDDQDWITKHPALGKNETIATNEGNSSVYSLNTGNPNIDKYLYGIMVKKDDATIQPVKFLNTDKTLPLPIDPLTEQWVKWSISESDIWKYDDVIVIDGNIALTTDPEREKKFTTNESYKRKGFRHNLLTEADLTIGSKGPEVESIQKKLGVLPITKVFDEKTKAAVIEFQTNMGILPATGIVDDKTLKKINDFEFPPVTPKNTFQPLSIANKSKGDNVKLIQQKLGIPVDGGFGTDTETAVIEFQTNNRKDLPNAVAGVVDIDTFNLIKRYIVNDAGINKVYSGVKTTYTKNDWIFVNPKLGSEGDFLAEKKYFKIKSINADRYTVVLDSLTKDTFDVSNVGGITAKILFGRDAETGSQTGPNNTNDSGNKEKGKRNNVDNSGRRTNSGTNTVDTEKQKQRKLRTQETCNTLREIKQYLNNTKGLSMVVNCKWNQEIRNQVMMALTGGTPVPVDQPVNNVVTSVPVTDRLF